MRSDFSLNRCNNVCLLLLYDSDKNAKINYSAPPDQDLASLSCSGLTQQQVIAVPALCERSDHSGPFNLFIKSVDRICRK